VAGKSRKHLVESIAEGLPLLRRHLGEHDNEQIALEIDERERPGGAGVLHAIGDTVGTRVEKIEAEAVTLAIGGGLPGVKGAERSGLEQRRADGHAAVAMEAQETAHVVERSDKPAAGVGKFHPRILTSGSGGGHETSVRSVIHHR
jgi:hypothetical protein